VEEIQRPPVDWVFKCGDECYPLLGR
jgi:hypothetical protein